MKITIFRFGPIKDNTGSAPLSGPVLAFAFGLSAEIERNLSRDAPRALPKRARDCAGASKGAKVYTKLTGKNEIIVVIWRPTFQVGHSQKLRVIEHLEQVHH